MLPVRLKLPDLSMTFRLNRVIPFLDRSFVDFFQEVDRLLTEKEKD